MHRILFRTGTIVGLALLLDGGLSWGQLPLSNDKSDSDANTGGGDFALISNSDGEGNTAYGRTALRFNDDGNDNTAIGRAALTTNTQGSFNTATGYAALRSNISGLNNTASGLNALFSNDAGSDNTACGVNALFSNTAGSNNTACGVGALGAKVEGSNNIALGFEAGVNLTSGSDNIYLGNPGAFNDSTTMRLGQDQTRTFIAGVVSVPMSGSVVRINASGQLGIQVSSARYKRDIHPMGAHSQRLSQLRPVTFRYRHDPQGDRQYGLIAEEVATVYPELIGRSATGEVESVQYDALIPMLLNELQHQQR